MTLHTDTVADGAGGIAVLLLLRPATQDPSQPLAQVGQLLESLQALLQHPALALVLQAQGDGQLHHCLVVHVGRQVEHGGDAAPAHGGQQGLQVACHAAKLDIAGTQGKGSRILEALTRQS